MYRQEITKMAGFLIVVLYSRSIEQWLAYLLPNPAAQGSSLGFGVLKKNYDAAVFIGST